MSIFKPINNSGHARPPIPPTDKKTVNRTRYSPANFAMPQSMRTSQNSYHNSSLQQRNATKLPGLLDSSGSSSSSSSEEELPQMQQTSSSSTKSHLPSLQPHDSSVSKTSTKEDRIKVIEQRIKREIAIEKWEEEAAINLGEIASNSAKLGGTLSNFSNVDTNTAAKHAKDATIDAREKGYSEASKHNYSFHARQLAALTAAAATKYLIEQPTENPGKEILGSLKRRIPENLNANTLLAQINETIKEGSPLPGLEQLTVLQVAAIVAKAVNNHKHHK